MILYLNLDGMSEKEAFKAIDEFIPRVAKRATLKQRSVEMSDNILTHERFSGAPVIAEEIEAKSLSGLSEWLLRTSASSADALSAGLTVFDYCCQLTGREYLLWAEVKSRFDALLNDLYAEVEPEQEVMILKGMAASMLGYVAQQFPGEPAFNKTVRADDIEESPLLKADPDIFTEDDIPL